VCCLCVCVWNCAWVCVCLSACVCVCARMFICVSASVYVRPRACERGAVCVCVRLLVYVCVRARKRLCACLCLSLAGTFNAQELANTLWAYATMGQEPDHFHVLILSCRPLDLGTKQMWAFLANLCKCSRGALVDQGTLSVSLDSSRLRPVGLGVHSAVTSAAA